MPTPVRVRSYRHTHVPGRRALHLMQRFSFGYHPALYAAVRRAGGPRAWFEQQLHPDRIPDRFADGLAEWFPQMAWTPLHAYEQVTSHRMSRSVYLNGIAQLAMLRRTYSNRQLFEVMVDFWLNHFHVFSPVNQAWPFRPSYDAAVRTHALGTFANLLKAADTHPAMLRYLSADDSTGDAINENLGRELLELHTVGRTAGYTEEEVQESARILTGQLIDKDTLRPYYDESEHYHGPVHVMGFNHPNGPGQGGEVLDAYLGYLAHHPATAHRIATKHAVRFVADRPPAGLVDRVATAYLSSGTDIKATLRALVDDPQFHSHATPKVRTPVEDVVATLRALGVRIRRPTSVTDGDEAAHAVLWLATGIGQQPWRWFTPDGFPDRSDAWASASRMLASFRVHRELGGGFYPKRHVHYRTGAAWLPQRRIRFDELVDHLCRVLHGRGTTVVLLGAAFDYLDVTPGAVITAQHPVAQWRMPWLLSMLLDSPTHMTR
jgi:uncharacterized protein (DUF1800 family)